ncbi:hypothetical protein GQX73_g2944 [Xylaria multiplex]|uniref:Ribosomal protein S11 n=1 Tax=Xylaria multiplex TaxID=323545 RepID=A0A7C8J4Q0_9PEZI|nr:hypothetical protein GQX73_g2944 [Xylaria multiplex]
MTPSTTRLLARTTSKFSSLYHRPDQQCIRAFSRTCLRQQDEKPPAPTPSLLTKLALDSRLRPGQAQKNTAQSNMSDIKNILAQNTISRVLGQTSSSSESILSGPSGDTEDLGPAHEPFHFHIYAHKHNTHITVTKPNRGAIVSLSAGNIGFKKSKRGSYDAAFQLCAYVLDKLNQGGWHRKITALEVVLRGFGAGREAATKVLLGNEGRLLRPLIKRVSDSTRLKFGGTRSPRPRRLG